jgi:hypothetical protein
MSPAPWFIRVAMAVAVAGVLAVALLWGTGTFAPPAFAQSWCASVETTMHPAAGTESFGAFMNKLQATGAAGAPVGTLVSDEQAASADSAAAQNDLASQAFSDLAVEVAADNSIKSDMEQLNRECGVPATYRIGSIVVPSSS